MSKEILEQESYSCENQDQYIYHLFREKRDGVFLDVACGHPRDCSNTYLLEKKLNWSGLGVDITDIEECCQWSKLRSSKFLQADATGLAFPQLLRDNLDSLHVDYLSLDVDAGTQNYSHIVLPLILSAGVTFSAITYEHESFKFGDHWKNEAGDFLKKQGYMLLFGATFPDGNPWEDWYIDPSAFDSSILEIASDNITYDEALIRVKKYNESFSSNSS